MPERYDICVQFGDAVRARRLELGLSQEELAAAAQINRTYIGDIERGTRNVALRNVDRICQALGLTIAELFDRHQISPDPQGGRRG